jgi:predicted fused transcriptional regulator/phosphomethylpyrimidine kinase
MEWNILWSVKFEKTCKTRQWNNVKKKKKKKKKPVKGESQRWTVKRRLNKSTKTKMD